MKVLKLVKNGNVICDYIEDASSFLRRFMGLMYRKSIPQNHGLLLTPCNEIHTFGMRFDIDAVYISKNGEVLFIDEAVKPHKVCKKIKSAYKVLELNSGMAHKFGLNTGDSVDFVHIQSK